MTRDYRVVLRVGRFCVDYYWRLAHIQFKRENINRNQVIQHLPREPKNLNLASITAIGNTSPIVDTSKVVHQ